MDTIEQIKKIINTYEADAASALNEIKRVLGISKKPDFTKIKNGDHFTYNGIEFVRLGEEQGGILCITADVVGIGKFNTDKSLFSNYYVGSSAESFIQTNFLSRLNETDLKRYDVCLTADSGNRRFGVYSCWVGLLSCDLYRKYRDFIPKYNVAIWTCTPFACDNSHPFVRILGSGGYFHNESTNADCGYAPVCIFKP